MEETRPSLIWYDELSTVDHICFQWESVLKPHHRPEKCLHYMGKWRQVCLACGLVEIDGVWTSIRFKPIGTSSLIPQ